VSIDLAIDLTDRTRTAQDGVYFLTVALVIELHLSGNVFSNVYELGQDKYH
jgi:hypothetical protein